MRGRLQGKEEAALCAVLQLTGRKSLAGEMASGGR
ncbi:putative acyl-CoA N-acyltransferase [Klebsiella pneumoniae subsp. pneumoniae KpMDU1]|nr:putative acyl-CoA N-acyltransferase [Klebsiella pneumoniae subsp. pneumoniae KpMDU1]